MSYELYSENGYVDTLASNAGFRLLNIFVQHYPGMPATKEFIDKGSTQNIAGVIQELNVTKEKMPASLKTTVEQLIQNLKKVKEVAIIVS